MLALDRCYCRSWIPATKHTHTLFTLHTLQSALYVYSVILTKNPTKTSETCKHKAQVWKEWQEHDDKWYYFGGKWKVLFLNLEFRREKRSQPQKSPLVKCNCCLFGELSSAGACCSGTIWVCEFLHMSFLGSETFSTPRSAAETRQPHPLPLGARSPCKNTSVHNLFQGELPVK